jgi:hypothetical protein
MIDLCWEAAWMRFGIFPKLCLTKEAEEMSFEDLAKAL